MALMLASTLNNFYSKARVSKLRPAGQIRPAKPFHPAREDILSIMKNQYIYEKFTDL